MQRIRQVATLLLFAVLLSASAASGASSNVRISQVYGGGGNSGATFTNDFVELFNPAATAVDVSGWSVQYATAAGTTWQATALSGSIQPGGYYLVQLASSAAVGSPLPAADATGTANLSATSGKIALVRGSTALGCGASAGSCAAVSSIEDLVGYGSAADYEGAGAAPGLSSTAAALRAGEGCIDTDVNSADFSAATPAPRNSSSPTISCGSSPPPASGVSETAAVDVDVEPVLSIALERSSLSFGHATSGDTPAPISEHVTVTSNNGAGYALTVHRSAFGPADLPLGLSASAPAGGVLGASLAGGAMAGIPIPPAADLLVGTTAAPSGSGGDAWATSIGFTSPLPLVSPGHYAASVTFTAIAR